MRIGIVDADVELLERLAMALEEAGHDVSTALDGGRGLTLGRRRDIDALISDARPPGMSGLTLCRRLRAEGRRVPILLLTSRDAAIDEERARALGVDELLAKPVSTRVVVARVAALLSRERPEQGAPADDVVRAGQLELRRGLLEVRHGGAPVVVTASEFRLLDALASEPGRVMSREELRARCSEDTSSADLRIIDTYVARLRRKLQAVGAPRHLIETVPGAGYALRPSG